MTELTTSSTFATILLKLGVNSPFDHPDHHQLKHFRNKLLQFNRKFRSNLLLVKIRCLIGHLTLARLLSKILRYIVFAKLLSNVTKCNVAKIVIEKGNE